MHASLGNITFPLKIDFKPKAAQFCCAVSLYPVYYYAKLEKTINVTIVKIIAFFFFI